MKLFLLLLGVFFSLTACHHSNIPLKERITASDSAAINYFKGDGTMDTVVLVKIVKDKKTLDQLSNLISEDVIKEKLNCGYDGSLHFFKNNIVIQDIYFRMKSDDCSQFTYSFNRESRASRLSGDAKKLLLRLNQ